MIHNATNTNGIESISIGGKFVSVMIQACYFIVQLRVLVINRALFAEGLR